MTSKVATGFELRKTLRTLPTLTGLFSWPRSTMTKLLDSLILIIEPSLLDPVAEEELPDCCPLLGAFTIIGGNSMLPEEEDEEFSESFLSKPSLIFQISSIRL